MQNILIVTNTQGMLVLSLKKQLEDNGFAIKLISDEIENISKVKEELECVILYLDEKMADNNQTLVYLKDKCVEENIPVVTIGDQIEIERVSRVISGGTIIRSYIRPISVNEAAGEITEHIRQHGKQTKKKILVVDDSGAMLRNVKGWLEDKYQVILANSGAMAIKYLAINRPDLVLLDYEMPVVDGAQVLEMIRSEADFADIPVIFLTSKNDRESVSNVIKLHPEGYLLKTMKPEEIVKTVDEFFIKQKLKNN